MSSREHEFVWPDLFNLVPAGEGGPHPLAPSPLRLPAQGRLFRRGGTQGRRAYERPITQAAGDGRAGS